MAPKYRALLAKSKKTATKKKMAITVAPSIIKKVVNNMAEKKFLNTSDNLALADTVWHFYSALEGLTQGSGVSNRIGNKIYLHYIEFQVLCYPSSTISNDGGTARFILYHNKETVGTLTTSAMVFNADKLHAQRNITLEPRVSVLRDRVCQCVVTSYDAAGAAGEKKAFGPTHYWVWRIYPKKKIDFQSNAGTISDLLKDDYGFAACSLNANDMTFELNTQVVFSDA